MLFVVQCDFPGRSRSRRQVSDDSSEDDRDVRKPSGPMSARARRAALAKEKNRRNPNRERRVRKDTRRTGSTRGRDRAGRDRGDRSDRGDRGDRSDRDRRDKPRDKPTPKSNRSAGYDDRRRDDTRQDDDEERFLRERAKEREREKSKARANQQQKQKQQQKSAGQSAKAPAQSSASNNPVLNPRLDGGENLDIKDLETFLTSPTPKNAGTVHCYVLRRARGALKLSPEYRLFMRAGKRFLLAAKKRTMKRTSNYMITMTQGDLVGHEAEKESIGKLR